MILRNLLLKEAEGEAEVVVAEEEVLESRLNRNNQNHKTVKCRMIRNII